MPHQTWTVRIELSETHDAVFANAVLVDGPETLTGHGRADVDGPGSLPRTRALASRRAITELTLAMRSVLERGRPLHVARL